MQDPVTPNAWTWLDLGHFLVSVRHGTWDQHITADEHCPKISKQYCALAEIKDNKKDVCTILPGEDGEKRLYTILQNMVNISQQNMVKKKHHITLIYSQKDMPLSSIQR